MDRTKSRAYPPAPYGLAGGIHAPSGRTFARAAPVPLPEERLQAQQGIACRPDYNENSALDSRRIFSIQPFADLHRPESFNPSKASDDLQNATVVTNDTAGGVMAALRFDALTGCSIRWRRDLVTLDFTALTGDPEHREIVVPSFGPEGEKVVWLNERTGEERAHSEILSPDPFPGNIVTPGFDDRFYLSTTGQLWQLHPRPQPRG